VGISDDFGKWIVVALVACVQLTILIWRKSTFPFAWKNLIPGMITLVCTGWCCVSSVVGRVTPWVSGVPVLCGLLLSSRTRSTNLRVGSALAGLMAALITSSFVGSLIASGEYVGPEPYWADGDAVQDAVWDLHHMPKDQHLPAGYVSAVPEDGKLLPTKVGPFVLNRPVPFWHSAITGLYGKKPEAYRLWLPDRETGLKDAILVPEGTPPGKELSRGISTDSYEDRYVSGLFF
jgi:hypothetical protein